MAIKTVMCVYANNDSTVIIVIIIIKKKIIIIIIIIEHILVFLHCFNSVWIVLFLFTARIDGHSVSSFFD